MRLGAKFRIILYFYTFTPICVMWFGADRAGILHDPAFQQAVSLAVVSALLVPYLAPLLPGFRWLIMSQLREILLFCKSLKKGEYLSFALPPESGEENEITSLMRTMNWMARMIENRETDLETQVRERTAELTRTNRDLERARMESEASARAKSEFLANMSHEVKTPINAIVGMAEIGLRSPCDKAMAERLSVIRKASRSLSAMVTDILDFSRMEAGKLSIETVPVRPRDLIEEVTDIFAPLAQEKEIELIVHIDPDVPVELSGDALRIRQILTNLLSNALKFTEAGEIVIETESRPAGQGRCEMEIRVRDTGVGIAPKALETLFDAFTQADGSTTRKYGGTGLGLAICRNLAEMMGGALSVTSRENEGSCFKIALELPVLKEKNPLKYELPDTVSPPRCLVVEDNPLTRKVLCEYLSAFGFPHDTAENGNEARELLADASSGYDILLLDTSLKNEDGFSLAGEIKPSPEAPVIFLANCQAEIQHAEKMETKPVAILKPVKQSTLFDAVVQGLGWPGAMITNPRRRLHTPSDSLAGHAFLLVEDNPFNRKVAMELLKTAGIVPDIAVSGREAIRAVRSKKYHAVLMDVQMPDMDGFEATRIIRSLPGMSDLPIVAITADAEDREAGLECGMTEYLHKPIDPDLLFKTLEKAVGLNDLGEARRIAHDIKGAAANISADRLHSAATELGSALKLESPLALRGPLGNCLVEINRFLEAVSLESSAPVSPLPGNGAPRDMETVAAELDGLDLLLSKNSMEARTRADALEGDMVAAGHGLPFQKVLKPLKRYDFKTARKELGTIRESITT